MVIEQYEVGSFAVFAYLVGDEESGKGLIIDPADETEMLINETKKFGLEIIYIVNTHSHVDHIMGNAEMKRRTEAKIIVHEAEEEWLLHTPSYMLDMFGAQPSPPADITVKEGDSITVGSFALRVIHTPGHSPGGISLHGDGLVFTGDTLFVGSVGRTDFPYASWEKLEHSIRTKLYRLPGNTIVYPGHNYGISPSSTIGDEMLNNQFVRG
ncbi:MAG: MBL fold metallo-hydrolase [Syntrophobacterales bacterium]|nr:MAG: MBL fold metallo-hydrolase [Syntrophobacterales bacterium]